MHLIHSHVMLTRYNIEGDTMEDVGFSFCCTACVQVRFFSALSDPFYPYFIHSPPNKFHDFCSVPDSCGGEGEGGLCQVIAIANHF